MTDVTLLTADGVAYGGTVVVDKVEVVGGEELPGGLRIQRKHLLYLRADAERGFQWGLEKGINPHALIRRDLDLLNATAATVNSTWVKKLNGYYDINLYCDGYTAIFMHGSEMPASVIKIITDGTSHRPAFVLQKRIVRKR